MFLSFKTIQVLACHSKSLLRIVASYLTYESRTAITSDIYFCWRRPHTPVSSLLCNLSLTWKRRHFNIIGIYVHLFLLPARDTVRPIITDWTSASNSRMHTNIIRSLLRICGPSSALWHLIDQLAVKNLKHDNMAVPQWQDSSSTSRLCKFPETFISLDSLALDSCHFISRATPICLLKFIWFIILPQDHDNNQLTRIHSAM